MVEKLIKIFQGCFATITSNISSLFVLENEIEATGRAQGLSQSRFERLKYMDDIIKTVGCQWALQNTPLYPVGTCYPHQVVHFELIV